MKNKSFRCCLFFVLLINVLSVQGQNRYTLDGYIKDSLSGETIIGAFVSIKGKTVASNQYGFYSITLPDAEYDAVISHVNYLTQTFHVQLHNHIQHNIYLLPKSQALNEIVVFSKRRDANIRNAQLGQVDLSISQVKNLPAFLGEIDILKTIQLIPGVRNAGEGNAGFYVRGGGPDQNLILLDDAVVYNTGHLFGFFSIFNSDAIKNASLIKGGMPAQYGGRLSSVLDISMKDGNRNKFEGEGGIGLISSRVSLQGPVVKNKASFIVSARRTYVDALVKPFVSKSSNFYGSGYYFYDLNAKINYQFSDRDRLYLSGYIGRDVFSFHSAKQALNADIPWGNGTATLRWNHIFNRKLFANTTIVYNDYKFDFGAAQNNFDIHLSSGIRDENAKIDFDYYPSGQHKVRFGGLLIYHKFVPNVTSGRQDSIVFQPNNEAVKYAVESALYVQDDWDLNRKWKVNYGLRYSNFTQVGPYTLYVRDQYQNKIDSTEYGRFDKVKVYSGFEPRVALRYRVNESTSLKASITRNLQFIHLVSNAGTTLPTDLWVPSTYRVKPQIGWLYSAGLFRNFNNNMFETSLELYYKDMRNQIEYKEGYTPTLADPEQEFTFGKGWSYGSELFINKVQGRLTGWIGYTLSWTWRKFPELNQGETYPAKYDRRHDLSVVATYELNKKWKFGSVFVYATGNATSLPENFYFISGVLTQEYSRINQYRLPAYHRLDLSATYTPTKKFKKFQGFWVFSIYNVYSHLNPYFIYFDHTGNPVNGTLKIQAKQVSLFPVLPSVTWNFKF